MNTENITIEVDATTAKAYKDTSPAMQRKINALLSLEIDETVREDEASLKEIMHQMSQQAQSRGLTPKILQDILDEPE